MRQPVILFFSCEPGGAEVLIPVIELVMAETQSKVIVLGYGLGAERFARKKIVYSEVDRVVKNDFAIMDTYRPNLIITSATSLPERDMSEKHLWHNARLTGVPTIAFLDQWQNYAIRFSGQETSERLAYLPDHINCINDIGEADMIGEGFDPRILLKFGQPYLSSLINDAKLINADEIKNRLGISPEQRVVLFVSEAISEHYGRSRGYDQYDAFRLFLKLTSNDAQNTVHVIKIHPKDAPEQYEQILSNSPGLQARIVKNELTAIESIHIAADVYGMTSIMLIEAYILGKKTISLQPGLVGEDPCLLSRNRIIPLIKSNNISDLMALAPSKEQDFRLDFEFKKNKFLEFIQGLSQEIK